MNKLRTVLAVLLCMLALDSQGQTAGAGSRMNEIFQRTDLIPSGSALTDPWEVAYGPDDSLWITEAKGYKVYKLHPNGGTKRTILDISLKSTWLGNTPSSDSVFNLQFVFSPSNPQGGLAGLAIHPDFNNSTLPKKYVYISYIRSYVSTGSGNTGVFYRNSIVRFRYNTVNGRLDNPKVLCDTLSGSSDHNSQRMIIAPVNGVNYLFYAAGDMGAGQFGNAFRTNYAQTTNKYEGKILRFNLEPDADVVNPLDQWIPNDNPFNTTSPAKQSAVWSTGIRNNQGFASANINGVDYLYGSSHGPFSDDEVNIIKRSGNYGHPLVIGFSGDGNYDAAGAGNTAAYGTGSLPSIVSESANAAGMANYNDPIYCFYAAAKGNPANPTGSANNSVQNMFYNFNNNNQSNATWPSEAPSGMDIYTNSMIPGWKNSLLLASLKGGKLIRLKLNGNGDGVTAFPDDTTNYFRSTNRFRDIALSPDGNSIFTVIDKSSTTSGPTSGNPIISACAGCVQKYTFLGYAKSGAVSTIPTTVTIASGKADICEDANTININSNNCNYWVPITDTNSNVIAEIYANGNILGNVTTSLFTKSGGVRETPWTHDMYLSRNITITPQTQPNPSLPVGIRLYLSTAEFNALKNATNSQGQPSGISTITGLSIFKNSDYCNFKMINSAAAVVTSNQVAFGASGYVVQANITSFSTFYFAAINALLPVALVSFKGAVSNDVAKLQWQTASAAGLRSYTLERSTDNRSFTELATLPAGLTDYAYPDSGYATIASPVIYYRLRMTDNDGKYRYSQMVTLYTGNGKAMLAVHPNPAVNTVTVDINATVAEQATWKLTDMAGKTLMQRTVLLTRGKNTLQIQVTQLPAGTYYLKLAGNNISQSAKLQKL
ncbi:MAG TPA: PQQ-dependent sugar dehydrogenase [Chitinophagaceae bacterium]|nr:PQQ-dependent sugar dehydrogenase [Chitinophagaceae bacterium]